MENNTRPSNLLGYSCMVGGFFFFTFLFSSILVGLLGILVGVFVAVFIDQALERSFHEQLIHSVPLQNSQECTNPPKPAQTTPQPENAAQSEDKEQIHPKAEEPPKEKKPEGVVVGVAVDGENAGGELILEPSLRIRHLYLIGKTRTGKTTLIKNLALQDMDAGHGLCFVDPHGDAADDLISSIPQHRIQDVIYFDPASETCPAFNIFRTSFAPQKLTEDIVNVLKMFFGASWGFRMEHILRYAILTLLHDREPRTLKDLRTLLINETYRAEIIANIEDEAIREFWELEFAEFPRSAVDPIVNKLSSFLVPSSPLLRLFSQQENALDFSRIMNEQKILIVNLSKGLLSEDPSRLLGGLIVTGIQQAALGRASMPPEQRKDFHLYLDEFQNFVVESFESILSEAAKYKLFLTLAHQTLGQVPGYLKHGIFGNIATLIAFQISAEDAATMSKEMHRMRVQMRVPSSMRYITPQEILEKQIQGLEKAIRLSEEQNGETEAKKNDPKELERIYNHTFQLTSSRWKRGHEFEKLKASFYQQCDDAIQSRLGTIQRHRNTIAVIRRNIAWFQKNTPTVQLLHERFGEDYEIEEKVYPKVDDFTNQQPRHAFCRKERAENVTLFRTLPAPDPNPAVKAAVLRESAKNSKPKAEDVTQAKPEAPRAEPPPVEQPTAPPDTRKNISEESLFELVATPLEELEKLLLPPKEKPQPQEAAPKPEADPVQAARERRAQKGTPKRSTPKRTPTPQNEEDFRF